MCRPGWQADVAFRVPALMGPFSEKRDGQSDCYMNPTLWYALTLTLCAPAALLSLYLSSRELHTQLSEPKKRSPGKMVMYFVGVFTNALVLVVIPGAVSWPKQMLWLWLIMFSLALLGIFAVVDILVRHLFQILVNAKSAENFGSFVGGSKRVLIGSVAATIGIVGFVVGGIGVAIFGSDENDVSNGSKKAGAFWTFMCLSCSLLMMSFFAVVFVFLGRFVKKIRALESSVEKASENVGFSKTADRLDYFRYAFVMLASPAGVGLWILHGLFLPMFAYAFIFHLINISYNAILVWYAISSPSRRHQLLPLVFKSTTSNEVVPISGQSNTTTTTITPPVRA